MTISPSFVATGEPTQVLLETPNERPPRATTSLEIVAPPGIDLAAAEAPDEDVVSFPLRVAGRRSPGNAVFQALQRYDDGAVVRWEATLTVVPAAEAGPDQHLGRAFVAGAVGLAVLAGSFFALRLLRR